MTTNKRTPSALQCGRFEMSAGVQPLGCKGQAELWTPTTGLGIALTCLVVLVCCTARADEKPQPLKPYRVIFNCDGWSVFNDAKGDVDQWVKNVFAPIENSQVDALFWCDGGGGNNARYKSDVLELAGTLTNDFDPFLKKVLDAGLDPPEIIVREAHKRKLDVYFSFRINDTHDAQPGCFREFPTFKKKHPEWQIGEGHTYGVRTALNFAVSEVRELKFRTIEEIFQKYDFDGLEIDFLRSPTYFIPGTEPQNAHFLTELLDRVRGHLNQRGKERGRPIRLAVRVDESLEACRLDGFDVAAWIDRELIDMVIMGSGVIDIEIEDFKKLAKPKGVLVYPCLYGWPSKYSPISSEMASGLALTYWHQGADGIYLFNWFPHSGSEAGGPDLIPLMKQVGDPETIRAGRKKLMFAADRGRPMRFYAHNWMHCVLPAALPADKALNVEIRVGADLQKRPASLTATLQISIDNLQPDDVLEVSLNQKPIKGLQAGKAGLMTANLSPGQLLIGRNQATLRLAQRSSKSEKPRTVTSLEIHLRDPTPEKPNAKLVEQHEFAKGSAEQGLALTKDVYYSATSRALFRFDTQWNLIEQKEIRIPHVNHLGAIDYHDGFIWVGLLHGPEGGKYDKALDRSVIAKIRADDFEVVQTWDITEDVTWIDPVCFDGDHLWVGDLSDLGIHRYTIQGDKLVRDGIFRYPKAMHFSQGIRVTRNKLYTIHTFGSMDGLFEFDIPETLTKAVNRPTRVWNIEETRMHLEGFDFVPGSPNQIWHAQGKGVDRYVLDGLEN